MGQDLLFYTACILVLGVVVILALGLGSFAKGGKDASIQSNRMMRYRLIAQATAVLVIVLLILAGGGN